MNISAFRLKTYLQCPLKYKYHYVQGLGKAYSSESVALNFSNLVHSSLFEYFADPETEINRLISKAALELGFTDNSLITRAREVIHKYIENTFSNDPVVENDVTLKVRWLGDDFFVKIDRLDRDKDGMLTITDYKTGKYLPSDDELIADIQMGLYRVLTEEKYGQPVKRIMWENVVLNKQIEVPREKLLTYDAIRDLIKGFKRDLSRSKLKGYDASPGSHCRFCDFRVICNFVDEDVRTLVGEDPILGDLYRINEMVKELSGVLDLDKLSTLISEKFKKLTGTGMVKLKLGPPPGDAGDPNIFPLNDVFTQQGYFKITKMPELSMKKEALSNSFLAQAGIFVNNALLYKRANSDGMTGFYHQAYLKNMMKELIDMDEQFSLIIFDLDHFKAVNDNYGHLAGDSVLIDFSQLLRDNIRLNVKDIIARYGGEEFAVVLVGADMKAAFNIAERVRKKMVKNDFILDDDRKINVRISGGVNEYNGGGESVIEIIEKCDQALYLSKEEGRNRISIYIKEESK